MKKIAAIFFSVLLMFSLSACYDTNESAENAPVSLDVAPKWYTQNIAFPECLSKCTMQMIEDDGIYLGGSDETGLPVLGLLSNDKFTSFQSPEDEYVYAACKKDNEIAVLCGNAPTDTIMWLREEHLNPGSQRNNCNLNIYLYSQDGNIVSVIPLNEEPLNNGSKFFNIKYINDKFILMSAYQLSVVNSQGELENSADLLQKILEKNSPGFFSGLEIINDEIYICTHEDNYVEHDKYPGFDGGTTISRFNADTWEYEQVFQDDDIYSLGIGLDEEANIIILDIDDVYKIQNGDKEKLFSWADLNIYEPNYNGLTVQDGRLYFAGNAIRRLKYASYGEFTDSRTELVLLCNNPSTILAEIIEEFNAVNDKYYVSTEITKANLSKIEIITGDTPDMYYFFGDDSLKRANPEQIFENLLPYFSLSDKPLIHKSLEEALTQNGKLYTMPFDFIMWTFLSPLEIPNAENLTIDELIDYVSSCGSDKNIFPPNLTKQEMWNWVCNLCVDAFTDIKQGKCNFNEPAFYELLQACNSLPSTTSNIDNNALISPEQIGNVLRMSVFDSNYNSVYTFVGCPTGGLSNGSAFELVQSFSMSNTSEHKDGVWEFFLFTMRPDIINLGKVSSTLCIPASEKQFTALVNQAMGDGYLMYMGTIPEYIKVSSTTIDKITELIEKTDIVFGQYPEIIDIMVTEAAKYFSGDKTIKETIDMIQSRASIVMSEKKP